LNYNDVIRSLAQFGLESDYSKLEEVLNEYIEYAKKSKKIKIALQLQSILKNRDRNAASSKDSLSKVGSDKYFARLDDRETGDLILERLNSEFSFANLISNPRVKDELANFIEEHRKSALLQRYQLPIANKILFYGPSGNGKTLASYVLAGELRKLLIVVNLGAIVSAKLGETSKNLAKVFHRAASENAIILIDELDSLGKVRDYGQDHGEMKRVVNTILQLFDYLPEGAIVIAATNQKDMIDPALLRRFDLSLGLEFPTVTQIKKLVGLTLKSGLYEFDKPKIADQVVKDAHGLSYFSIQKTLVSAIKRSVLSQPNANRDLPGKAVINTAVWKELLKEEKAALAIQG
jgi:SpoVK/Ycf46/Vps4 family AAA+-type ATPase